MALGQSFLGWFQKEDRKEAEGYGTDNREVGPLPLPSPCLSSFPMSSRPPLTLEGCQKPHDQDGGWDFKCIVDLIMEICGISSCMP